MLHYLEPRTDVPAKDDWSTRLAFAAIRTPTVDRVVAVLSVVTFVATFFAPESPGNTLARFALAFSLLTLPSSWLPTLPLRRARRSRLLDEPWRRVPAAVAETNDHLLLDGQALKGSFGGLLEVVRERQEVFVRGPDARGHALVRVAGSTWACPAEVVRGEFRAGNRLERPRVRPADDERIQAAVRMIRSQTPFLWAMHVIVLVVIVLLLGVTLLMPSPTGLVAAALFATGLLSFPGAVELRLRERDVVKAVRNSHEWRPVPMTLFPWQRGHHVAGIAELPGGPALVRFPWPLADQIANIAATGVLWIAGRHENTLAVSVPGASMPGTSGLTFATVRPGGAARTSDPMSWPRRLRQPDFSALPR
ncbi:hypothetical protein SK571_39310 [Lentzea sp. BCCO 10_0798]|uniref:PH domain-containing protein n=1 Tax=Lentzea kristufekii TaxID=3095430 RepID=A0ABU4U4F0_9PSEU|nr:hypothetical protein [Lentzea sp. BCCO 10_0798]MDX8055460.1 hypothetical protein [Lentzea sp. BCCO 10_0798]